MANPLLSALLVALVASGCATSTEGDPHCPDGMAFDECGSGCGPFSCDNLPNDICPKICRAGCFCPEGLVKDQDGGDRCIPLDQCHGDPLNCPVTGEWFVDWDASYECLSQLSQPYPVPGQILPLLTVTDIIQAAGAAWTADNLIEAEGEICVRIMPQLGAAAFGADVFRQYCDPVLTSLREGTTLDAEEHCRLILNLTGFMTTIMSEPATPQPDGPTAEPDYPLEIFALRPFDFEGVLESIVADQFGVSIYDVDNICRARQFVVDAGSTLEELVTNFLEAFVEVLIPRAAEICNSWNDILVAVEATSSGNFSMGPDINIRGFLNDQSDFVARWAGYESREAMCQRLSETRGVTGIPPFLDDIAADVVDSILSVLTDAQQCTTIVQGGLDLVLMNVPGLDPYALNLQIYQITGINGTTQLCQVLTDAFQPEDHHCPDGMAFDECGSGCGPSSCDNLPRDICPRICSAGCFCPEGLVKDRDSGDRCIPLDQCQDHDCPEGMTFYVCGSGCGPVSCDTLPRDICPLICRAGCYCPEGLVKDQDGGDRCIPLEQCRDHHCPEGMIFNECGSGCGPSSCDNLVSNDICPLFCFAGCFCPEGLVKDRDGGDRCIPLDQCQGVPLNCPVTGEWFVDWGASNECLSLLSQSNPFAVPGQILPLLTVTDIIQAAGAAWTADNLIEAEGEICVRIMPQLGAAAFGADVFRQYCDPVLTSLREGTTLDAEEHCRLILNLTGFMTTIMSASTTPQPDGPTAEPDYPLGIFALRPFDFEGVLESIVADQFGVSVYDVDNICRARQFVVDAGSTLEELVTDFLVAFVEVVIPRAAEICNSWNDILVALEASSSGNFSMGPDINIRGYLNDRSDFVARWAGYESREAMCQRLSETRGDSGIPALLDDVAADVVDSILSVLTDAQQCSTIVQEGLDLALMYGPGRDPYALNLQIYQITGTNGTNQLCQVVADAFQPGDHHCPEGMAFDECGSGCGPFSCDNLPNDFCPRICSAGCFCPEGLVKDQDGGDRCIPLDQCQDHDCPEGMTFNECGSGCGPSSCDNLPNDFCPLICRAGCFCPEGLVKDRDGGDRCLPLDQCQGAGTGAIRLVGGSDEAEGRVEIQYNGVWGTICDDLWGITDANVVCRMLGFQGASGAPGLAHFGQGTGPIQLDDVGCSGVEQTIFDCAHPAFGVHNCRHNEDAGVVCIALEAVRLVGGSNEAEGRVEIQYNGVWGTICDDSWGIPDANVVCRMLGFQEASGAPGSARFGQGTGPIQLDDVGCSGDEQTIFDCAHPAFGVHNCFHSEDAGVVCIA